MRGRVVHHVYAEDEPTRELGARLPADEQSPGLGARAPMEEQSPGLGARAPMEEQSPAFGDQPLVQSTWRFPRQARAVAMALLGAAIAFVAALAIHALHGGSRAVVLGRGALAGPVRSDSGAGPGIPAQSPHRAAAQMRMSVTVRRRARRRIRRSRAPSRALTGAGHADGSSSTARAVSVTVARVAGSEFNFER
jgi:hypothetical protein